jgi:hypothetical protein
MEVSMDELRALVAQSILSTEAFKEQLAASQEAADRRAAEYAAREAASKAEADRRAAEYAAREAASKAEADRRAAEYAAREAASKAEADRRAAEAEKTMEDLKRTVREVGKQLGGLGNKFGSFTEGLLLPSIERILFERFGVTDFSTRVKSKRDGALQELDGFGFVNGQKNIGFIVEVKSRLDNRAIEQVREQVRRFGAFHPYAKGMTVYGILAAVDTVSASQRQAVFNAGLYLVTVDDDVASMPTPPDNFTPFSQVA